MADNKDKKPQPPKEPEKRNYPDGKPEKLNENIRIPTYQNPPSPPPKKDDQKK